jgi:hypothetical protein
LALAALWAAVEAGLGLLAAALSGKRAQRLASAAAIVAGAAAVLLALLAALWFWGALPAFYDDTVVFMLERYKPYHAGVAWGRLPAWGMLDKIPHIWRPVWAPTLALAWACVYVLPCLLLYSFFRWVCASPRAAGHKILWLMSAAIFLSVIGNGDTMRIIRLSAPLWLLLAFELDHWAARARGAGLAASGVLVTGLLLVLPIEWSFRSELILVP